MTDQEILQLIKTKSNVEKGFKLLMSAYQEKLYYSIRRIVENHDDTDDVLQNTFIKAFKAIDHFEERSSLYTWLYRIAVNEALSFKKTAKHKATESYDIINFANKDGGVEDLDMNDAMKKFEKAMKDLPEKQRTVFNMRYYDETPYEEMSELLHTSVGALKASYHHAMKKIETALLT